MLKQSLAASVSNFTVYGVQWKGIYYSSYFFCLVFELYLVLDRDLIFYQGKEKGVVKDGHDLSNTPLRYDSYIYQLQASIINLPKQLRGYKAYAHFIIVSVLALRTISHVACLFPTQKLLRRIEKSKVMFYHWNSMLLFYTDFWLFVAAQLFLDSLCCKDYYLWVSSGNGDSPTTVIEESRMQTNQTSNYINFRGLQTSSSLMCLSVEQGYVNFIAGILLICALLNKTFEHLYHTWLPRVSVWASKLGNTDLVHQATIITIMSVRAIFISRDSTGSDYVTLYAWIASILLFVDLTVHLLRPPFLNRTPNQLRIFEILTLLTAALIPFSISDLPFNITEKMLGNQRYDYKSSNYQPMKDFLYKTSALGIPTFMLYKLVFRLLNRKQQLSTSVRERHQSSGKQSDFSQARRFNKFAKNRPVKYNSLGSGSQAGSKASLAISELETLLHSKIDHKELIEFIACLLDYSEKLFSLKDILKVNRELAEVVLNFKSKHHDYLSPRTGLNKSLANLHNKLIYFELEPNSLKKISPESGLNMIPRFAASMDGFNLPKGYLLEPTLELVDSLFKESLQDVGGAGANLAGVPALLSRYFIYFNSFFRGKIANSIYHIRALKFSHMDEKDRSEHRDAYYPKLNERGDFLNPLGKPSETNPQKCNLDYLILQNLLQFASKCNLDSGNSLYFHNPSVLDGFKIHMPVYKLLSCVLNINTTTQLVDRIQHIMIARRNLMLEGTSSEFESKSIVSACKTLSTTMQEIKLLFGESQDNTPTLMTSTRLLKIFYYLHVELNLDVGLKELADLNRSVYHHETELVMEEIMSKKVFGFGFDTSKRNYQKVVAYLSAEPATFHKIIYTTANIEKALGFKSEDIQGEDLEAILPRPIRNYHKDIFHPKGANSVFISPGTEFNFFVRNSNEDILPCLVWVRISPNLDNGLALVGLLSVQIKTDQITESVKRVILSPNYSIMEMCEGAKLWFDYERNLSDYCQLFSNCLEVYERVTEFKYENNIHKIEDLFGTNFSLSDYEDYAALSEGVVFKLQLKDQSEKLACLRIKHVKTRRSDQLVLVPEFIECNDKHRFRNAQELHFVQELLHSVQFGSFDQQIYDWQQKKHMKRPEPCINSLVSLMGKVRNLQEIDERAEHFLSLNMIPELSRAYIKNLPMSTSSQALKNISTGNEGVFTGAMLTPNSFLGQSISPPKTSKGFFLGVVPESRQKKSSKNNLIINIMKQVNPQFEAALEQGKKHELMLFHNHEMELYSETDNKEFESSLAVTDLERINGQSITKDSRFKSPKKSPNNPDSQSYGQAALTVSSNNVPITSIRLGGKKATKNSDSDMDNSKNFNRSLIARGSVIENSTPHISNFGLEFHNNLNMRLRNHKDRMSFHNDSPKEHYVIDQLSDKSGKRKKATLVGKALAATDTNVHQNYLLELARGSGLTRTQDRMGGGHSSDERPVMVTSTDEQGAQQRTSSQDKRSSFALKDMDSRRLPGSVQHSYLTPHSSNGPVSNSDSSKRLSAAHRLSDSVKDLPQFVGVPQTRSRFESLGPSARVPEDNASLRARDCLEDEPADVATVGEEIFLPVGRTQEEVPGLPTSTFLPLQQRPNGEAADLKLKVTFGSAKEGENQAESSDQGAGILGNPNRVVLITKLNMRDLEQPTFAGLGSKFVQREEEETPKSYGKVPGFILSEVPGEEEDCGQGLAKLLGGLIRRRKRWGLSRLLGGFDNLEDIVHKDRLHQKSMSPGSKKGFNRMQTSSPGPKSPEGDRLSSPRKRLRLKKELENSSSTEIGTKTCKFDVGEVLGTEFDQGHLAEPLKLVTSFERNYSNYVNLPLKTFRLCRYLLAVVFAAVMSFVLLFMIGFAKTSTQQDNFIFLKKNIVILDEFTWGHYEIVGRTVLMELALAIKSNALPADIFGKFINKDVLEEILIPELIEPAFKYSQTSSKSQFRLKQASQNFTVASGRTLDDFKPWEANKPVYRPQNYSEMSPYPVAFSKPLLDYTTVRELAMLWSYYLDYFELAIEDFRYQSFAQINQQTLWLYLLRQNGVDLLTRENFRFIEMGISLIKYKMQRVVNTFTYLVIPEQALGMVVLLAITILFVRVYKYFSNSLETLFRFSRVAIEAEVRQLNSWIRLLELMVNKDDILFHNLASVFPASCVTAYNLHEQNLGDLGGKTPSKSSNKGQTPSSIFMSGSPENTPHTSKSDAKGNRKNIMSAWSEFASSEQDKIKIRLKREKRAAAKKKQHSKMSKYSSVTFNSKCFGLMTTLAIPLAMYLILDIILLIPNMQNISQAKVLQNQLEVAILSTQVYNHVVLGSASLWYALVLNDTVKIGGYLASEYFELAKKEIGRIADELSKYKSKDLGASSEAFTFLTTTFKACEDFVVPDASFYMRKFENCTTTPGAVMNTDYLTYLHLTSAKMDEIQNAFLKRPDRGIEAFRSAMADNSFSLYFTYTNFLFVDLSYYTVLKHFSTNMVSFLTANTPSSEMLGDAQLSYIQVYLPLYLLTALLVCFTFTLKVKAVLKEFLLSYKLVSFRLMHHNPGLIHFVHRETKRIQGDQDQY